jgi:hypothetical protein
VSIRRGLLAGLMAAALSCGVFAAEVYVHVGPPRPLVERRVPPPGPGYVWVPGYHRWDGRAYVWVPGNWVVPPHHHAHWVQHRWVHRPQGWVMIEGHWR